MIGPRDPPLENMKWIPGGEFLTGSDKAYPEEAPAHRVRVDGFWMDRFTVTNRDFEQFVAATGYVTLAEKPADPGHYPGALPGMLVPSSTVFKKPTGPVDMRNHYNWWAYVRGASWRHPRGPASTIRKLADHPVVHVVYEDVLAYAGWAGKDCRPKPNGSSPRAAGWTAPNSSGATNCCRAAATWPTPGKASSRSATIATTGTSGRPRSVPFQQTAMGFETWLATSGSGPPTGTRSAASPIAPAAPLSARAAASVRRAMIRPRRTSGFRAR